MKFQSLFFFLALSIQSNAQSIIFETRANFNRMEVEKELAKYPALLLKEHLQKVIVVSSDKYCGLSFAFAKKFELNGDCDRCNFRATIHHELSSLFLLQYDFYTAPVGVAMRNKFIELNGAYSYTNQVEHGRIEPDTPLGDFFYNRKYAMHSFENDFNVIAESLFQNGLSVISFMEGNPKKPVSKKIRLVLDFYYLLDSSFTINYFKEQKI
jgi:hypothetical protein